jgi:ubiquinone/menaquinone biosynthesis C-methylase UbiE
MFTPTARYYDKIYSFKDYRAESEHIVAILEARLGKRGGSLLDVACGTGLHDEFLKKSFQVDGIDMDQAMLAIAVERNPELRYFQGDMTDFELGENFDAVVCLFSSIGYVRTLEGLEKAIGCMARHLIRGGVLLVEPWFTAENWHAHSTHGLFIDEPELKIARVNTSYVDGRLSIMDMHYLIGTPQGTEHIVERHELGLFELEEMRSAFVKAGLDPSYDPDGLTGRGLWVGKK